MVHKKTKKSSKAHKENIVPKIDSSIAEKTIQLDSTDETDIIECSVIGYENKTVSKEIERKLKVSATKSEISSYETKAKTLTNNISKKFKNLNDTLRKSIENSFRLNDNSKPAENDLNYNSPLNTPCSVKNNSGSKLLINKIISTLKKTPEAYLSKSKLRNIQQWLCDNDVETVRTPPFANLSVTPRNSAKSKRKCPSLIKNDNGVCNKDSSIDSEVEDVLKAVYGEDWKKNRNDKCKTEPRKKVNKVFFPATEVKESKADTIHSVRRNILKTTSINDDKVINLDDSNVSGVKLINLDDSNCSDNFIKTGKLDLVKKRKLEVESSPESLHPKSAKKKKVKDVVSSSKKSAVKNSASKNASSSIKTPKKTFLASLSVSTPTSRCHPDAQYYKVNFKSKKDELVKKLYKLYNGEVFEGKLAEDMSFSWNVKLRGTAGFCYNKRITKSTGEIIRLSRIEFSTKIVDRADRLRDTMIHELCHAASWVIDGVLDGHGSIWSRWAAKAMDRFPELPIIKRCHNYDIVSKYVYRCTGCGYSIKRHSKSINIDRKRCGHCFGVLELLLNKKKKGNGEVPEFDTTRTLRTPNKFALFVKENYHSVKSLKTNANHAEIMKTLSQQYALIKNGTRSGKKIIEE